MQGTHGGIRDDRGAGTNETLRGQGSRRRSVVHGAARPGDRLPRAERLGQDHDDADDPRSRPPDRRVGHRQRHAVRRVVQRDARGRCVAGRHGGAWRPQRACASAVPGRDQRHPAPPGRRGHRHRRAGGRGRQAVQGVLARHEPAAGHRRGPARRPGRAHVRRAGQRPGPRGHPVDPAAHAVPGRRGPHGVRLQPPDVGDGEHRRSPHRDRPRQAHRRLPDRRVHHGRNHPGHQREDPGRAAASQSSDRGRRPAGAGRQERNHSPRPVRRAGRRTRARPRHLAALPRPGPGLPGGGVHGTDRGQRRVPGQDGSPQMTTAAIATRTRAVHAAVKRPGLPGALRSELTKILSVRSTYWTLLAFVAASSAWAVLDCAGIASHGVGPSFNAAAASLTGQVALGELIIVVLGALVITSEYSTGMIRTSLAVMPRRGVLYAAKAIVFAAVTLSVSLVASFADFFVGQAILASKHLNTTLAQPGVLRAVLLSAAIVTVFGLLAYGAGAIIRHTAGAITAILGVIFLIPALAEALPTSWFADLQRWLPGRGALDPIARSAPPIDGHLFSAWGEFAVFSGYAAVLLAVGAWLFVRRDA